MNLVLVLWWRNCLRAGSSATQFVFPFGRTAGLPPLLSFSFVVCLVEGIFLVSSRDGKILEAMILHWPHLFLLMLGADWARQGLATGEFFTPYAALILWLFPATILHCLFQLGTATFACRGDLEESARWAILFWGML